MKFFIPFIVFAGLLADQSWYQHLPWWASITPAAVAVMLAIAAWGALSALRDWRRS